MPRRAGMRIVESILYIESTRYKSGSTSEYGPNLPVPPPIDTANNIYQCSTRGVFSVGPTISMQGVPWLGSVPGLGTPVRLNFAAERAAEYPSGLTGSGSTSINVSMPPAFNTAPSSPSFNGGTNSSGWRNPQIYQLIATAGKTIVQENVVTIYGFDQNWGSGGYTGVTVNAGEQVWLDTQAEGDWTLYGAYGYTTETTDANGDAKVKVNGFPNGALLGQIGSCPWFLVGAEQMNMAASPVQVRVYFAGELPRESTTTAATLPPTTTSSPTPAP